MLAYVRSSLVVVLGATLSGCFFTETEVITATDSAPLLGGQFETRDARYRWHPESRSYLGRESAGGDEIVLRVASLTGDVYVLQVAVESSAEVDAGYALALVKAAEISDAWLLECEQRLDFVAWAYGVELESRDQESFSVAGERARIVGFFESIVRLGLCGPQNEKLDPEARVLQALERSDAELALSGAPPLPPNDREAPPVPCRRCASFSNGCVQGLVVDQKGNPLAHMPFGIARMDSPEDAVPRRTDARGAFFVPNLAPGLYEIRWNRAGFRSVRMQFEVRADETAYLRELELEGTELELSYSTYLANPVRCPSDLL